MTKAEKSREGVMGRRNRVGVRAIDDATPAHLTGPHHPHPPSELISAEPQPILRSDGVYRRQRRSVAVEPAGGETPLFTRGGGGTGRGHALPKSTNGVYAPDGYTLAGDLPKHERERLITHMAEKALVERRDSKKGSSMLRLLTAAVGSHRAAMKGLKSCSVKTWASQVLAASAYHMRIDPYEFAHISAQSVYDSTDQFPQADSHARGRLCVKQTGRDSWDFDDYQQSKTEGPRDGKAVLVWSDRPAGFRLRKPGVAGGGGANTLPMKEATLELVKNKELPSEAENLLGSTVPEPTTSAVTSARSVRTKKMSRRGRGYTVDEADSPYVKNEAMEMSSGSSAHNVRRSTRPRKKIMYNVDHDTDIDEDAVPADTDHEAMDHRGRHRGHAAAAGAGPAGPAAAGSRRPARKRVSSSTGDVDDYIPDASPDHGAPEPMATSHGSSSHGASHGSSSTMATHGNAPSGPMSTSAPPRLHLRQKSFDMDAFSRPDIFDRLLGYDTPAWRALGGGSGAVMGTPTAAEDSTSTVHSLTLRDLPRHSSAGSPFSPGIPWLPVDGCSDRCCSTTTERLPLSAVPPTPALFRTGSMELEPSVAQSDAMEVSSFFAQSDSTQSGPSGPSGPSAMETEGWSTGTGATAAFAVGATSKASKGASAGRQHRISEERRNPAQAMARRKAQEATSIRSGPTSPSSVASKASSAMSYTNARERHIQSKRMKVMVHTPPGPPETSLDDTIETDMELLGPMYSKLS